MWISEIDLRALLGHARAEAFIQAFAGQEVNVPAKPRKDHPIAQAVGAGAMGVLCREYGMLKLSVPNPFRGIPKNSASLNNWKPVYRIVRSFVRLE